MVAGTRNVGSLRVGDLLGALPSSGSNRTKKTHDVKRSDRMADPFRDDWSKRRQLVS